MNSKPGGNLWDDLDDYDSELDDEPDLHILDQPSGSDKLKATGKENNASKLPCTSQPKISLELDEEPVIYIQDQYDSKQSQQKNSDPCLVTLDVESAPQKRLKNKKKRKIDPQECLDAYIPPIDQEAQLAEQKLWKATRDILMSQPLPSQQTKDDVDITQDDQTQGANKIEEEDVLILPADSQNMQVDQISLKIQLGPKRHVLLSISQNSEFKQLFQKFQAYAQQQSWCQKDCTFKFTIDGDPISPDQKPSCFDLEGSETIDAVEVINNNSEGRRPRRK